MNLQGLQKRDWENLFRLQECGDKASVLERHLLELEDEWCRMVGGQSIDTVPDEKVDRFFAVGLFTISPLLSREAVPKQWHPRLLDYFNMRAEFRRRFRPRLYRRVTREELKRFKAVFDVWDLCASETGRNTTLGRYYQSYRLELAARLAPLAKEREEFFLEAARVCLQNPKSVTDPLDEALLRRGLILKSQALRSRAFALVNTNPTDLRPIEEIFQESLDYARKAQEVWEDPEDIHSHYLGFWTEVVRLRRAEVDGEIDIAREAHAAANRHLSNLDQESLFREPHTWFSFSDFQRENSIIEILETLKLGPAALSRVVVRLNHWLDASRAELAGTVRLRRMELRLRAIELLEELEKGESVSWKIPGLFRELGKYPSIGRHTWEIANQVEAATRDRIDLSAAVTAVARLFPLDSQGPLRAARVSRGRWELLPYWYQSTFESYRLSGDASAGVLTLLWYARTVADYTWQVYVKNLQEQGRSDHGASPDFMLASLSQTLQALRGLSLALCWTGQPGNALDNLIALLNKSLTASPDEIAQGIAPAVFEDTAQFLYPFPLLVNGLDSRDPNTLITTRFSRAKEEMRLTPVKQSPDAGSWIYIKPRFKQSEALVKQDFPLFLYPARAFGKPHPTLVLCEGVTDQAVLESVLDHLEPHWRALQIAVVPSGGDTLPTRFRASLSERPVVIADADKRYDRAAKPWKRMWEMCCHGWLLDPDLERLDLTLLAEALSEHWGCSVATEDLRKISSESRTGFEFERKTAEQYDHQKEGFKSREFGTRLGVIFVRRGLIPAPLIEASASILQLANGRQLPCKREPATPFHKCPV